jgi:hypothetical protein
VCPASLSSDTEYESCRMPSAEQPAAWRSRGMPPICFSRDAISLELIPAARNSCAAETSTSLVDPDGMTSWGHEL